MNSLFAKLLKNIIVSFAMRKITSINIVHTKTNHDIYLQKRVNIINVEKYKYDSINEIFEKN